MLHYLVLYSCFRAITSSVSVQEAEITYLSLFYEDLDGPSWKDTWDIISSELSSEEKYNVLKAKNGKLGWNSNHSLVSMNLSDNGLAGSIPDNISNLSELVNLTLPKNDIVYLPDISGNKELIHLDLSENSLQNYTDGRFPSNLISIKLNNNSISSDISDILSRFDDLDTVEKLDLDGNSITGTLLTNGALLDAAALTWLGLTDNELTGDLPEIKDTGWTYLNLSYNAFTGQYPSNLGNNPAVNLRCNLFNCSSLTAADDSTYPINECFCPSRGYMAYINETNNAISCERCDDGTMANKWVRFNLSDDSYTCEIPSIGCVDCFFPQNCVAGSCETGSKGPTCEVCDTEYRMVGGKCQKCLESEVPIAALVMLVFIAVIIGYGIFLTGLNMLAATMIKQIVTYFQIYYLTMDIRVSWPTLWTELGDVYKLSMLNTQAFDLDCLIPSLSAVDLFYIHWSSAVIWPVVLTIVVILVDKSYSKRFKQYKKGKTDEDEKNEECAHVRSKQSGMRRIYIMFMLIAFVPITALSVRTYACDAWSQAVITVHYNDGNEVIDNQWFYDNSVDCYGATFQIVNFLATLLCIAEFGIVVFLFLILFRLWRFDLKDKQNEIFGALYESFNEKGLFCEPILLLRKFILILTTQVTYLDPVITAGCNTVLSFAWLSLVLIRQPYIPVAEGGRLFSLLNNWCNIFEIAATILITLTQAYALVYGIAVEVWDEINVDGIVYTLLVFHILLVIVWIIGFIVVLIKYTKAGIKDRRSRRSLRSQRTLRQLNTMMINPGAKVTPVLEEGSREGLGGVQASSSSDVMIPKQSEESM